ncbi:MULTISPECIES: hypothetical protein [unclassified Nonomuraea]|uniref:hypothetical protein n=1 Tax=Nonomuraea sp. NPDC047529 TaxID=3155623 RepID=UPI0033DD3DBE
MKFRILTSAAVLALAAAAAVPPIVLGSEGRNEPGNINVQAIVDRVNIFTS